MPASTSTADMRPVRAEAPPGPVRQSGFQRPVRVVMEVPRCAPQPLPAALAALVDTSACHPLQWHPRHPLAPCDAAAFSAWRRSFVSSWTLGGVTDVEAAERVLRPRFPDVDLRGGWLDPARLVAVSMALEEAGESTDPDGCPVPQRLRQQVRAASAVAARTFRGAQCRVVGSSPAS